MKKQAGQALIIVIIGSAALIATISTAILTAVSSGKNAARDRSGREVYYAAEAGNEYALLKLMRNPSYSICPVAPFTETISMNSINVSLSFQSVFGGCYVKSTAQKNGLSKTIQVFVQLDSYISTKVFNYCCWSEIP